MVVFLFGLLVYLYFFWVFSELILFAIHWLPYAGSYAPLISSVFPFSCDASGAGSLDLHSVLINLFVFVPFFLQHTIMARPWFKNNVTYKLLPFYLERSLFVLVASISMHFGLTHWNSSSPEREREVYSPEEREVRMSAVTLKVSKERSRRSRKSEHDQR